MEVLVEPLFSVGKRLSVHNVHESLKKFHVLEEKVEMSKYQLRIPGSMGNKII